MTKKPRSRPPSPCHDNLGLGRHWHFLVDLLWLLTGLVYVAMLFHYPGMAPADADFLADYSGCLACVTQMLRQGDAKVFKKYSQMKLGLVPNFETSG